MGEIRVPRRITGRWVVPADSRTIHATTLLLATEVVYRWLPCLCGDCVKLPPEPPERITGGPDGHSHCQACVMHFAVIIEPVWGMATERYPEWLRLSGALPPVPS